MFDRDRGSDFEKTGSQEACTYCHKFLANHDDIMLFNNLPLNEEIRYIVRR